jgi:transcription elongation factor Elf1
MDEIEKFFKCPFCLEKISMILDISVAGEQTYVEDCEVCCNPIQISYSCEEGKSDLKIKGFSARKAYG